MLSPCAGLLPAGHGFQRGDWLLCTFPPTGTPGISVTTRGDVSVEAEVVNITPPPGQGILVRMVGELGKNAGRLRVAPSLRSLLWIWPSLPGCALRSNYLLSTLFSPRR